MRKRRLGVVSAITSTIVVGSALAAPVEAQAADVPDPTANYDMSHDGDTLKDTSGNDNHATLHGTSEESFLPEASADVLNFTGDEYAELPSGIITNETEEFTVELTVAGVEQRDQFAWVLGDGIGKWNTTDLGNYVFVNPSSGENGEAFGAIRVKEGDDNGEDRMDWAGNVSPGMFSVLTLVGEDGKLTLYIDGEERSVLNHDKSLEDIVPDGDVAGYLGRSQYEEDGLFQGKMSSAVVWDSALEENAVQERIPSEDERRDLFVELAQADILQRLLGENESADQVKHDLSPPSSFGGADLEWESSNPDVVSETGKIDRFIEDDETVTLTATDDQGAAYSFDVTVIHIPEDEQAEIPADDLAAIDLNEDVVENLPLVTEGEKGSEITWTSSDVDLVTETTDVPSAEVGADDPYSGAGIVTRPEYGEGDVNVSVTATATFRDYEEERSFDLTIKEKGRSAPDTGYVSAYFKADDDEKIYQAATTENDFFTFEEVNDGEPTIVSTTDDKGLRDPFILRSVNDDRYYMVATDLCIGCSWDWAGAQQWGSLKIHVYESEDLVNWTPTSGDEPGITVNQPLAGMTWAPEVYWDNDLESYVVFFASRMYEDADHTKTDGHAQMFYVLTRDFKHFTYPPEQWQDTGHSRIDSTVMNIDDEYYRFTKNEAGDEADGLERGKDIFLERSTTLTAPTYESNPDADPNETWELIDTSMTTPFTGEAGEGPEIVKLNEDDPNNTEDDDGYVFLVDNYSAGGYVPFVTTGEAITNSSWENRLSKRDDWEAGPRDGLPESPRHGAFVNVPQRVQDAVHDWTDAASVPSTTTAEIDGNTVEASVTAEDDGDVVGSMTFTLGDWSQTVPLSDQAATVDLPENATGELVVSYDGYHDGIVETSEFTVDLDDDDSDDGAGDDGAGDDGAGEDGSEESGSGQPPGDDEDTDGNATDGSDQSGDTADNGDGELPRTGATLMPLVALALTITLAGLGVLGWRRHLQK